MTKVTDQLSNYQIILFPCLPGSTNGKNECREAFNNLFTEVDLPDPFLGSQNLLGAYSRWTQALSSVFSFPETSAFECNYGVGTALMGFRGTRTTVECFASFDASRTPDSDIYFACLHVEWIPGLRITRIPGYATRNNLNSMEKHLTILLPSVLQVVATQPSWPSNILGFTVSPTTTVWPPPSRGWTDPLDNMEMMGANPAGPQRIVHRYSAITWHQYTCMQICMHTYMHLFNCILNVSTRSRLKKT